MTRVLFPSLSTHFGPAAPPARCDGQQHASLQQPAPTAVARSRVGSWFTQHLPPGVGEPVRVLEEPNSLQPPDPPRSDGCLESNTGSNWQKSFNPCRV